MSSNCRGTLLSIRPDTHDTKSEPCPEDPVLSPVDPSYQSVMRIVVLLVGLPVACGASFVDHFWIAAAHGPVWLLTVLAWGAVAATAVFAPSRRYARIGYSVGDDNLRVARGYLFRVDTIVPFVRVQHIDLRQGPVERLFGLAGLVLHTSGSHNSTVTLPGLPSATAAAMREAIRKHIQSDFA